MRFAVALCGSRVEQVGHAGDLDFYDAKGVVQSVLEAVIGDPGEAVIDASLDTDAPYLHPRRRARLRLGERSVGVLGEIHPDITEARGLASRMVYAELDVELLVSLAAERGPAQARPLPRFPAVSRDLAFEVDESARVGELASTLRAAAGTLCEAVELFDVYRGSGIVEGRKSVAFRVVYRDPAATLTDKRVDKAHSAVRRAVQTELGAMLRE